ncbi:MAG: sulfatase [Edaphobacter sp.]
MDRRQFVQNGVLTGVAAAMGTTAQAAKPRKQPNVLYIFDDEHRYHSLPGDRYNGEVIAPNIDAFRKANCSMEQCISNYPLCSPYRGILMTGLWPYQNGITGNWILLGTEFQSIGHTFQKAGYKTSYVGKWHLSGPGHDRAFVPAGPHRQGFEDWYVWGAVNRHMSYSFTFNPDTGEKIKPMGYQATLMTDQAVKLLKEKKPSDKPWMMIVSWHPPHFPTDDAPEADEATYRGKKLTMRPNIKTGEGTGPLTSEEALQVEQRGYYAHITAIDREFGRLLKTLDETGQADNTIVVFTSDHGEMLGSHGRMHKRTPFEESIRVPYFVRIPGTKKKVVSEALFASIDMYPTLCGLAGLPVPEFCKGKDMSPIMRGESKEESDHVFLINQEGGHDEANMGPPPPVFRGIRTKTHTYAVASEGRWFLFDNEKDPLQQHNLLDDPAQKGLINHFDGLIAEWLKSADDPFPYAEAIKTRTQASA